MEVNDSLVELSKYFPEIDIEIKELESLKIIKPNANKKRYLSCVLILSAIFSVIGFLLMRTSLDLTSALKILFLFGVILIFLIKLPSIGIAGKINKMEKELPLVLRTLALLFEMKVNFQKALKILGNGKGELNKEIKKIVEETEKGASLQKTFAAFSASIKSLEIKRAISQIISSYQSGTGAEELKKLADELLSIQRFKLREYASKAAIFGLLFIAFSTILPTFFIVTTILGKTIFQNEIDKNSIGPIFLIIFPALSGIIVLIAKSTIPNVIFSNPQKTNYMPIAATLVLAIASLTLQPPISYIAITLIFLLLIFIFFQEHKKETKIREIEDHLPDGLMAASGLPKGTKIDKIFEIWIDASYGPLSDESKLCLKQLRANVTPEKVIMDLSARNESEMLKRSCDFFIIAIDTNTIDRLSYVAEDILKFKEIDRERQNALSMQRYTLLFASFLMPLIIKSSIKLASDMQKFGNTKIDFSIFYEMMPVYIILYGLLTSYFIAELEARKHSATLYFIISILMSAFTFYFINL